MAEPTFSSASGARVTGGGADDDLPRTLRRERDAQARRAREHELSGPGAVPASGAAAGQMPPPIVSAGASIFSNETAVYSGDEMDGPPVTVTRLDVPFVRS